MNAHEALAKLGINVNDPVDALAMLRALMPEETALINEIERTNNMTTTNAEANETARAERAHEFLWLDLETTGLDPMRGLPLEFAAVLCEDGRGDDFAIVQQYAGAIHYPKHVIDECKPDDVVLRMHERNGLWGAVESSTVGLIDVDDFLASLCASLTTRKRSVVLAGSSVHFDLAWARVHFPRFTQWLSHRVFDVSTLTRAARSWAPEVEWPRRDAHRALDDVLATIAECRVARAALLGVWD